MKAVLQFSIAALGAVAAGATIATAALAADVTSERLINSEREPQNWLNHHGNYEAHRFSGLAEINKSNVKNLRVAFTWAMGGAQGGGKEVIVFPFAGLEGTPVAEDGFLYLTTGWGEVTKLDVRGGVPRQVWKYDPAPNRDYATTVACCGINNRGAVLAGNMVISIVIDGRVLALNKTDGTKIWEVQVADPGNGEVFTGAPLIVKDMVVTGMAGAEFGVRGWIEALDMKTGKRRWRTYTIPGPGEPGHETWKDNYGAWKTGGGSTWVTGSYDPELNLIVWGTANPGPDWDNAFGPVTTSGPTARSRSMQTPARSAGAFSTRRTIRTTTIRSRRTRSSIPTSTASSCARRCTPTATGSPMRWIARPASSSGERSSWPS